MSKLSVNPLPSPAANQAYCDVSALEGGMLRMPCAYFVSTAKEDEKQVAPSLAFLVTHSESGARLVFDLGIRRDLENLPGPPRTRASEVFKTTVPLDIPASLEKGGLKAEDVHLVILSHCHWDHVGNPHLFTNATFVVGAASRSLFNPGWPQDPSSAFASDMLPEGRTEHLDPESWQPLGPFPRAFDYFGDGSMYIIDAPGHLPGHVNLLARTSADGGWIYLAGDSAHDWRLIRGEGEIADFHDANGTHICLHRDKAAAEETIRRISEVASLPRVHVILAHDSEWFEENKGGSAFWPGKIPSK